MVMNGIGYVIPKFRIVNPVIPPCFIELEGATVTDVVAMETSLNDKIKLEQCLN
tara:strand:- start:5091 stop:5252 length:162 start_codon:yes stop_codon:yes gene_type:complete